MVAVRRHAAGDVRPVGLASGTDVDRCRHPDLVRVGMVLLHPALAFPAAEVVSRKMSLNRGSTAGNSCSVASKKEPISEDVAAASTNIVQDFPDGGLTAWLVVLGVSALSIYVKHVAHKLQTVCNAFST